VSTQKQLAKKYRNLNQWQTEKDIC
jgi:hypothetical protein